ncbi:PJA2 ligase, partial [Herpetotheres cachinnans]|nr:PJA2 ligase [Herpetotheres cachinnans]
MGQKGGKLVWHKPAGYHTITGRRYGRRHAYVHFRPSSNSQSRDDHKHNEDCEQLELEDVQRENSLCYSPLVQVSSGLLDEPLPQNAVNEEPISHSTPSQNFEVNTPPFCLFSYDLEGNQMSRNLTNPSGNSVDFRGCNDLNGQNGIALVNIDSSKPDSNDGEQDDDKDRSSLAREETGVFQERLENMLSELVKDCMPFSDVQSKLSTLTHSVPRECCKETGPVPLMGDFSIDAGLACLDNRTFRSSAEHQAVQSISSNPSGSNHKTQQIKNIADVGIGPPIAIGNELNVNGGNTDQGNSPELVVRPKVRKQNTANQLERENLFSSDDEENGSLRRPMFPQVCQDCAECPLRNSRKVSSSIIFDSREYEGHQKNTEIDLRENAAAQEHRTFCSELQDHVRQSISQRDEDSSECSDGECFTAVPTYFTGVEKDQSSSAESWKTVPCSRECGPEVQSSSSGVGKNTDFHFQGGEQILLEEGEIPWLQYHEELQISSEEENDPISDIVNPGFFLLDGNNNLEDDSSVNEDLDVEWRLLDEFGDGLGLAQAIPHTDVQFIPLIVREGRLQQVMESALENLVSLEFEETPPPATKETIDCLPHIVITDNGQEQCCTICCSEYVEDEIVTELPCHHLFHKLCVTHWLQKSGTCPVCRHVLAPVLPEAAAATVSFPSDHDSASSV